VAVEGLIHRYNLKLNKADAKAIVKVLLSRIAPNEKLSFYDSMKKCNKWLVEVLGGPTWALEMRHMEKESDESPVNPQRLFRFKIGRYILITYKCLPKEV